MKTLSLFNLIDEVEVLRVAATDKLDPEARGELGQFLTPAPTAAFMAKFFDNLTGNVRILDAGSGVGSLIAATLKEAVSRGNLQSFEATFCEVDKTYEAFLNSSIAHMASYGKDSEIRFSSKVIQDDFITHFVDIFRSLKPKPEYDRIILNPPYLKIGADSHHRKILQSIGIDVTNLYSAFVALSIRFLSEGGELIAITPRSFCNGPYFKAFRQLVLNECSLNKIHVFKSRTESFKDDKVLQENIIFHLSKTEQREHILISSSTSAVDDDFAEKRLNFGSVVDINCSQRFIHIITSDSEEEIANIANSLPNNLEDLGIKVSTGKVVDFRNKKFLREHCDDYCAPMIYPTHIKQGTIDWPSSGGKNINGFSTIDCRQSLLVDTGNYVITKRISSKEEPRRIVASVIDGDEFCAFDKLAFDNKTNFFHSNGRPLDRDFCYGLSIYLNSTLVDKMFRQFNGHTQVNATDLRLLKYPSYAQIVMLSQDYENVVQSQERIDARVSLILNLVR